MFFEHSLKTRIEELQERIWATLNTNVRDFGAFRQQYAPQVTALYEEVLANENKNPAKLALIGLLQMETVSAVRIYELFFHLDRTDIFSFAHSARAQFDSDIFNTPTNH